MDTLVGILMFAAAFLFLVWICLAFSRVTIRPRDTDQIQTSWGEMRQLKEESMGLRFWRFVAIVEFIVIVFLLLASQA